MISHIKNTLKKDSNHLFIKIGSLRNPKASRRLPLNYPCKRCPPQASQSRRPWPAALSSKAITTTTTNTDPHTARYNRLLACWLLILIKTTDQPSMTISMLPSSHRNIASTLRSRAQSVLAKIVSTIVFNCMGLMCLYRRMEVASC